MLCRSHSAASCLVVLHNSLNSSQSDRTLTVCTSETTGGECRLCVFCHLSRWTFHSICQKSNCHDYQRVYEYSFTPSSARESPEHCPDISWSILDSPQNKVPPTPRSRFLSAFQLNWTFEALVPLHSARRVFYVISIQPFIPATCSWPVLRDKRVMLEMSCFYFGQFYSLDFHCFPL